MHLLVHFTALHGLVSVQAASGKAASAISKAANCEYLYRLERTRNRASKNRNEIYKQLTIKFASISWYTNCMRSRHSAVLLHLVVRPIGGEFESLVRREDRSETFQTFSLGIKESTLNKRKFSSNSVRFQANGSMLSLLFSWRCCRSVQSSLVRFEVQSHL